MKAGTRNYVKSREATSSNDKAGIPNLSLSATNNNGNNSTPTNKNTMLVLRLMPRGEVPASILLKSVRDIVACHFNVAKSAGIPYGGVKEDDGVFIYFPSIVINNDPVYNTLIKHMAWRLTQMNVCEMKWETSHISIVYEPNEVEFQGGCSEKCERVTQEDLDYSAGIGATSHNIVNLADRFELLLGLFRKVHIENKTFFRENIRYLSSAFYHYRKKERYHSRMDAEVPPGEWVDICEEFDVDSDTANIFFDEASRYSYTTITLEEILRREKSTRRLVNGYNEDNMRYTIRDLIKNHVKGITGDIWRAFAEFIRHDHFYADGFVYILDGSHCRKCIKNNKLRAVVDRFITIIRDGWITIQSQAIDLGDTISKEDEEKIRENITIIIQHLDSDRWKRIVEGACENYLDTTMRTEVRKTCVAFKDGVVEYDAVANKLYLRKAFMEDQFTSASEISIMNFGNTERERQAVREVKEALRKMLDSEEDVKWAIKWMGSLFAHKAERVAAVWCGSDGKNGKTTLAATLQRILGCACDSLSNQVIVSQKGNCGHTDAMMRLKNIVLGILSETDPSVKYSSSMFKLITGGDPFSGSGKHKETETIELLCKLMLLCNKVPEFDDKGLALFDRVYILDCVGRFCRSANPDPAIQEQERIYPIDSNFWNNTRVRALAYIMRTEGFDNYVRDGLGMTPNQKKQLDKYKNESNDYMKFAAVATERHNGKAYLTDAWEVYSKFKNANPRLSNMSYKEFEAEFTKNTGYRVITEQDTPFFKFYHPGCPNRTEIASAGI
jgi:hypothetical protein